MTVQVAENFTPNLEDLGYELIKTLTEEQLSFLKRNGGIQYHWNHKHKEENPSTTLCSCGVKYPYIVSTCYLCGNKKFNSQTSYKRKHKDDVIYVSSIQPVKLTTMESNKLGFMKKFKVELGKKEFFFNFETNDLEVCDSVTIFHFGNRRVGSINYEEFIFMNEQSELYPMSFIAAELKLNQYMFEKNIKQLLESIGEGYLTKLPNPFKNIENDLFFKNVPKSLLKPTTSPHSFFNRSNSEIATNYTHLNKNLYNLTAKTKSGFFKLKTFIYDYILELQENYEDEDTRIVKDFAVFNQDTIKKAQAIQDVYDEEKFNSYPQLKGLSITELWQLDKIINNKKTDKHTIEGIFEYFDFLLTNEVIEKEEAFNLYYRYITKSKKPEMYPHSLKLKVNTL